MVVRQFHLFPLSKIEVMADNYLEKKMEEFRSAPQKSVSKKSKALFKSLLQKNRGFALFDSKVVVRESHLNDIIQVNEHLSFFGSAANFEFVGAAGEKVAKVLPYIDEKVVLHGVEQVLDTESIGAFVVVCARSLQMTECVDLGISIQSMSLRATEMGLNGTSLRVADPQGLRDALETNCLPVAVLAIGKGVE